LYFVSHSDESLIEAVRRGRKEEFAVFRWKGEPPDPQDERTFLRSLLDHELAAGGHHRALRGYYREVIRLRKEHPALSRFSKEDMEVSVLDKEKVLLVRRWNGASQAAAVGHFGDSLVTVGLSLPAGKWEKVLDSSDERWGGSGPAAAEELDPKGEFSLSVNPKAFLLLSKA
jgi:maltooligosyltrehalose trehalohydrolase